MSETAKAKQCTVKTAVKVPMPEGVVGTVVSFDGLVDGKEHFAIYFGDINSIERPLVRVHSECLTGDVFGSLRCDCGPQLNEAIHILSEQGGVLVYMRQEGRGIGLYNKLEAYALQDQGMDTFEANKSLGFENDLRDYTAAGQMLTCLGVDKVRLMTNNPEKTTQIGEWVDVVQTPTSAYLNPHNKKYLSAKVQVSNHTISI